MKLTNKLFAALVLFGMSNAAFGYNFTFTNATDKAVDVKIDLRGQAGSHEKSLQPNETSTFSIQGSYAFYCLASVRANGKALQLPVSGMSACKDASFELIEENGNLTLK